MFNKSLKGLVDHKIIKRVADPRISYGGGFEYKINPLYEEDVKKLVKSYYKLNRIPK